MIEGWLIDGTVQFQRLERPVQAPHELRLPRAALALQHQELLPPPHAPSIPRLPSLHLRYTDTSAVSEAQHVLHGCRPLVQAGGSGLGMVPVQVGQHPAEVLPSLDELSPRRGEGDLLHLHELEDPLACHRVVLKRFCRPGLEQGPDLRRLEVVCTPPPAHATTVAPP